MWPGRITVHTCGLRAAAGGGDLYCWGRNDIGQLGLGYATTSGCQCVPAIPTSPVLTNVTAVAVGAEHTCALFSNATVACWGGNAYGQLGLGSAATTVLSVSAVPSLTAVIAVSAGTWDTCAVMSGGTLLCWGSGNISPLLVSGISGVTAVACGDAYTCALTSWGGVYCWGSNAYGQLGNGGTTSPYSPPVSPILAGVAEIAAGLHHACALFTAGGVYCWGANGNGELGLGWANSTGCSCVASPPSSP